MKTALLEQHTASDKRIEKIQLDEITTRGLQTREKTDPAKVAEYAERYRAGAPMPPIVVFEDGKKGADVYWLGDGHHRVAGARKAELDEIEAIIKKGDQRDALWYATAANAQHGLPRSNEDKRKAVALILADAEWRQLSDAQIAEHAQVSDRLVAKVRKEIGAESETRKGKDGRTVKKKTKAKPAPEPATPNGSMSPLPALCHSTITNTVARELMGDGDDVDPDDPSFPDLPPGIYLDRSIEGSESLGGVDGGFYVLISSEDAGDRLQPGMTIRTTYGTTSQIVRVTPYRLHGCLVYGVAIRDKGKKEKDGCGSINELVFWNGELRHLYAANTDRCSLDGSRPKKGKDDTAALRAIAKPLPRPGRSPEEIEIDKPMPPPVAASPAPAAEPPAQSAPSTTEPDIRPLALRRLDRERELVHERMLHGKPQWRGTDDDLFALALICGVPTRATAWCDAVRKTARDSFLDALRTEVADRVRNGEATHRRWPDLRTLCYLWGQDYESLQILAARAIPE